MPGGKTIKPKHKKSRVVRKPYVDHFVTEKSLNDSAMPVDYTFQRYEKIENFTPNDATRTRFGKIELSNHIKYLSGTLWLNTNRIANIKNIDRMVNNVLEYPERLAFLDLSHNKITEIDACLMKLKNLKILYLHDNNISELCEVFKLRKLKALHNLTLYGNPIYERPTYGNTRTVIRYLLPDITKLDHRTLSGIETALPVGAVVVRFLAKMEGKLLPYIPCKIKDELKVIKEDIRDVKAAKKRSDLDTVSSGMDGKRRKESSEESFICECSSSGIPLS